MPSRLDHRVTQAKSVDVVARATSQDVGRGIGAAIQNVVQGIARPADCGTPCQRENFEAAAERVADRRLHGVARSRPRCQGAAFFDHVTDVVDDIDVGAATTPERIGALPAIQQDPERHGGVELDHVVERIAGEAAVKVLTQPGLPAGVGVADKQGLHVVRHHVVVRASNQHDAVVAFVSVLQHGVCLCGIVAKRPVCSPIQVVHVVTQCAGQGVGARLVAAIQAGAPVEDVVAGVARDEVVEGVAGAAQVDTAGQGEVFEIAAERPAHLALNGVDALVGALGDRVTGVVHHEGVVACRARHRVGAAGDCVRNDRSSVPHRAAVAELDAFDLPGAGEVPKHPRLGRVAGEHNDQIVAVTAERDVRWQHVAAKQDAVGATGVDDRVAPRAAADLECVVVGTTVHHIVAQAPFQRVCADATKQ